MKKAWNDFWYFKGESITVFVVMVFLFWSMIFGFAKLSEAKCNAQTESIGFPHRWSFLGDCQIEVTDGQWIPLESYYFKQE